MDLVISQKLKSAVSIPAHLHSSILAGGKILRPRVWHRRAWMAAAASFLILAAVFSFWNFDGEPSFSVFRSDMIQLVSELDRLDLHASDVAQVREWLHENDAHADFTLTEGLEELPTIGCRIFSWKGQKVTLICFGEMGPPRGAFVCRG